MVVKAVFFNGEALFSRVKGYFYFDRGRRSQYGEYWRDTPLLVLVFIATCLCSLILLVFIQPHG